MSRLQAVPRRMLALLVLSVAALGLLITPAAAQSSRPPGLTAHQEDVVLDLIDDICGDTWCEGDHAFDFRSFTCRAPARTCTLRVRIAPYSDGPLDWRWRAGKVRGFVRFGQMVTTGPGGQHTLREDFYLAVNDLVNRLEATVPTRTSGLA